jgi:hypothetical protein
MDKIHKMVGLCLYLANAVDFVMMKCAQMSAKILRKDAYKVRVFA